jgi:hypothetical protein
MAFLLPSSVGATVKATGSWKIHQDSLDVANDLHFTIWQKESDRWIENYNITVGALNCGTLDSSSFTPHDDGKGDGKTHAVDCKFWSGSLAKCCTVLVNAELDLSAWNTVRIRDIMWTYEGADSTDDDLPDNGFTACKAAEESLLVFTYFNDDDDPEKWFYIRGYRFDTNGTGYVDADSLWDLGSAAWDIVQPDTLIPVPAGGMAVFVMAFEFGDWLRFSITIETSVSTIEVRGQHQSDGPTYVDLASLDAVPRDDYIEVSWTTANEIDNAGFNVRRGLSPSGAMSKINKEPIAAQGDALKGGVYAFRDYDVDPNVTYYYWLEDVDVNGNIAMHGPVSAKIASIVSKPVRLVLDQNAPNPFGAATDIRFGLPTAGDVVLAIYNPMGQRVSTMVQEYRPAGYHVVSWDGTNDHGLPVSGGIYYYRLEAAGQTQIRKMVYLK